MRFDSPAQEKAYLKAFLNSSAEYKKMVSIAAKSDASHNRLDGPSIIMREIINANNVAELFTTLSSHIPRTNQHERNERKSSIPFLIRAGIFCLSYIYRENEFLYYIIELRERLFEFIKGFDLYSCGDDQSHQAAANHIGLRP